jgi:hypothetical protein
MSALKLYCQAIDIERKQMNEMIVTIVSMENPDSDMPYPYTEVYRFEFEVTVNLKEVIELLEEKSIDCSKMNDL